MPWPGRAVPILTIFATLSASDVLAQAESICGRDLMVARSMQRQALDQLESTNEDQDVRCRVWRRHVETMRRIAVVYGRCLTGPERKDRLAEVRASETEIAALMPGLCQ